MRLRIGSVCSGIGGAELAFDAAVHVFASEVEAFPRAVLRHHYPDLHIHGDFTTIPANAGPVDVLVGGTPCQSFSVAGLRGGLADERGNLALEYLRLADRLRPTWTVWENVPGVLSSNGGRDFGAFVGGLAELGYGWAYRSLDAQHFGLAQRRKRVFVVGCLGDWRRAAAVLFEPACLRGHPPPRREAGQRVAATVSTRAASGTDDMLNDGGLIAFDAGEDGGSGRIDAESETFVTHALDSFSAGRMTEDGTGRGCPIVAHSLRADGFDAGEDGTGRGTPLVAIPLLEIGKGSSSRGEGPNGAGFGTDGDPMFTLQAGAQHGVAVAFTASEQANSYAWERDVAPTLHAHPQSDTSNIQQGIRIGSLVRRLTPTECERLQGFPDGWTDIAYRGRPAADGPRYRALGNAFAVNVVRWIARRIAREHNNEA